MTAAPLGCTWASERDFLFISNFSLLIFWWCVMVITNMSFEFIYGFAFFSTSPATESITFFVFIEKMILHIFHYSVFIFTFLTIEHFFFNTVFEVFNNSFHINSNQLIFFFYVKTFVVSLPAILTTNFFPDFILFKFFQLFVSFIFLWF